MQLVLAASSAAGDLEIVMAIVRRWAASAHDYGVGGAATRGGCAARAWCAQASRQPNAHREALQPSITAST